MSITNSESLIIPSQCLGHIPLSDFPSIISTYSQVSNISMFTDDCIDSGSMAAQQIQGTETSSHFAHYSESSLCEDCGSQMDRYSSKLSSHPIQATENERYETPLQESKVVVADLIEKGTPEKSKKKTTKKKQQEKTTVVVVKDIKEKHKKKAKK
ncbi:Uncharacterized protein QTN25_009552 [Entamoeba marina]